MASPPADFTASANLMSVPRPAILVAIVTCPGCPASATMSASFLWSFAFNTLWGTFRNVNILPSNSLISTDVVPINIGRPSCDNLVTSSMTALYFSRLVLYTKSCLSSRVIGLLVGISTTSNLYISQNSPASVTAVPVIPDNLRYILK